MPSVIVSPAEQKKFAAFLKDRTNLLLSKKQRFMDMIEAARVLCQDEKYAAFRKKIEETARALDDFKKRSDRYEEFLRKKAIAGERYLRG